MAKFQQRHYQAVADIFSEAALEIIAEEDKLTSSAVSVSTQQVISAARWAEWELLMNKFVRYFQADNPSFKESLFRDAASA